jgi:hypothetical protein
MAIPLARRRHIGWVAATAAILIPIAMSPLFKQRRVRSIAGFHRLFLFLGLMWMVSILAGAVAGRFLSPRWYYLTGYFVGITLLGAFVIWFC